VNTLLVALLAIAALDSLNPTANILQIYLLSTPKPVVRSLTFIFGVFATYWFAGVLAAFGLTRMIAKAMDGFGWFVYDLQLIVGCVLIAVGATMTQSFEKPAGYKRPKSLAPLNTFLLGVAVTSWEFPLAIPYIAAIDRLVRAKVALSELLELLLLYSLIFVLPQIVLLALYIFNRDRSAALLDKIGQQIVKWSFKVLRIFLVVLGFVLIVDSIAYFSR
jgi:cytochrome c biogenesis protein CcdA